MENNEKPTVNVQGKIVAERDSFGFLVMFPDGSVEFLPNYKAVERAAKEYGRTHATRKVVIEWR